MPTSLSLACQATNMHVFKMTGGFRLILFYVLLPVIKRQRGICINGFSQFIV